MSTEANKILVRGYFAELDKGSPAAVVALLAPNYVAHWPGTPDIIGADAFVQAARMSYAAFPDLQHTIEDQVAEGDTVVTRLTPRGTHRGAFQGIAPTGKPVAYSVVWMHRLADGKLTEGWRSADDLGRLQQLGVIPPPA